MKILESSYEVMITSQEIQKKVVYLADLINEDYKDKNPILVCNLKGAFIFLSDFCRCLTIPHEVDFMSTSSYKKGMETSGIVRIVKDLKTNIIGRNVLIIEDIVDTGLTLNYIKKFLALHNPLSIRVVSLLNKKDRRKIEADVDYIGFEIPDKFIIGYGLDYEEKYRGLKFIAELIDIKNMDK